LEEVKSPQRKEEKVLFLKKTLHLSLKKLSMKKLISFLGCLCFTTALIAQSTNTAAVQKQLEGRNSSDFHLSMCQQYSGGDLKNTFGSNYNVGVGVEKLYWENGFIWGIEGNYLFGSNLNVDPFRYIRTAEGELLAEGSYADIGLKQRGFFAGARVGRLWKLHQNTKRIGGIRTTLGIGFLQHWIRIQDNQGSSAPQVNGFYANGYDRLTNGFALNQFIGYQMMSFNRGINFFAGVEFTQGFTKNRRGFNFDTRLIDDAAKKDILIGIRAGWIITIKMQRNTSNIEY
jgi:hypothetical protein